MIERRDDTAFQRYRRRVWLAIAIQGFATAAAIGLSVYQNRERADDIRRASCDVNQLQNEGIVAYLSGLGADEQQIKQARIYFPKRDCSAI